MRRDRGLAFAGFLLAVTALLLPWWSVTYESGGLEGRETVSPFRPEPPLTTTWAPWLTGILAAVAALVLFVRLAANSHEHEPASWRRDLAVAATLLVLAAASCLLWPQDVPAFWGGRTYSTNLTDGEPVTETAMPGLGWWLVLVAAALAALAWRLAPRAGKAEGAEPSTPAGTTDK